MPEGEDFDFIAYHARASGSRRAVVDLAANRALSFRELDDAVARCTGWLSGLLKPGARVAHLARNSTEGLLLHFACIRAGLIFQPLNWRLSGHELGVLLADATPDMLIYQDEFAEAAEQALKAHRPAHVLFGETLTAAIAAATPSGGADHGSGTPVTLLYTSGTTGKPKGVIITRRNAFATALNFAMIQEIAPRDVLLCDMPLFHTAGLFGVARSALYAGATVLISDRFIPAVALARMSDAALAITHYFAVPQMAMAMLQDPAFATSDLSRLKALVIGGAPLPRSVVDQLLAANVMPIEGYGLSEGGTVFGMPLDRAVVAAKAGSAGVAAPLTQARLVDQDGRDVPAGAVGEIWLKGPTVTPGYWNQPEANARAFQDGWYRTGDAAWRDEDGFYRIVDRWKDMYISGGENVYPAEVESALVEHPAIAEAAVIGVPDAQWGESGCAYLVLRGPAGEDDVRAHLKDRLARYKLPKYFAFVDVLPRTGSGKVKKEELRRAFRERGP